ncbi:MULTISPECIES: STAS domain-containing protein [Colwellia]|uniref:STAS domain-containing protein n=1 Tax=Colwellia marinimaniae TaxID=1513592 RepID=A0ABQ0MR11_9GAMM|nr:MULTISPECIES: hypothetical protein [Colwellia]GAW94813.1 hypothetical protein MTCD1_00410 [Colwellia marinimaniae]
MAEITITQASNDSTEIVISGELTIYCAMEVFQQHFKQLKVRGLTLLKLDNITEIDTAGVQLLIMLMKIVNEQNCHYQVISLGEALTDYSNLFQLNRYFIDFEDIKVMTTSKTEEE